MNMYEYYSRESSGPERMHSRAPRVTSPRASLAALNHGHPPPPPLLSWSLCLDRGTAVPGPLLRSQDFSVPPPTCQVSLHVTVAPSVCMSPPSPPTVLPCKVPALGGWKSLVPGMALKFRDLDRPHLGVVTDCVYLSTL